MKDPQSRRSRNRKKPVATPEEQATEILRRLRGLSRTLLAEQGLSRDEKLTFEQLSVPVNFPMSGGKRHQDDETGLAAELVASLSRRLSDSVTASSTYQPGRVYCFQCDSGLCIHTAPPSPADLFVGYTATGKPSWEGFANVCLARKDERVERIYGAKPEVITFLQGALELKGELLEDFGAGSLAYNVVGQVVAGMVPVDFRFYRSDAQRVALTLQAVETWSDRRDRRLRLNLLGMPLDEITELAQEGAGKNPAQRFLQALRSARFKLESIGRERIHRERTGTPIDLDAAVWPVLQSLRGDLDRILRFHPHRTLHAEERHRGGERPTRHALEDARRAPLERVFYDQRNDTFAITGPRHRGHLFSAAGKHVTSFLLDSGELDRRTRLKVWVPATRQQLKQFKKNLQEPGPSGREV